MPKSTAFDTDLLNLIFKGTPIPNIADNAASSPLTNLSIAAHTADPGVGGTQSTNEATYTGYARVNVARGAGWTVTGSTVKPAALVVWPACTGGSAQTITHFSIGPTGGGATKILYSGTVTPNIAVSTGVTPELSTATAVTES